MRHTVTLTANCMTCKADATVDVTVADYQSYAWGNKLVQNVWPTLSTWERETIIGYRTGVFQCHDCWAKEEDD